MTEPPVRQPAAWISERDEFGVVRVVADEVKQRMSDLCASVYSIPLFKEVEDVEKLKFDLQTATETARQLREWQKEDFVSIMRLKCLLSAIRPALHAKSNSVLIFLIDHAIKDAE